MNPFEQLGLQPWLSKQCDYMCLRDPTPIQRQCIPAVLAGRHVLGGAATGSGKTAAFALPILQLLAQDVYGVFALVLTPSRELAYQVMDQFIAFGAPLHVRTMLAIGGVRHEEQLDALQARPHIVVATPGRLLYLLQTFAQEVKRAFGHLRFLVLDEADRLTEGDVAQDVHAILRELPPTPRRQVLLFTATLCPRLTTTTPPADGSTEVSELLRLGITEQSQLAIFSSSAPETDLSATAAAGGDDRTGSGVADVAAPHASSSLAVSELSFRFPRTLQQCYVFIPSMVKLPNLVAALRARGKDQTTIVFANSCMRVELVRLTLQLLGFPVCSLDSLLTQQHRLDNLALFKLGIARVMVATDIAARGLDIPNVSLVVHYDVPKHATTYVHRVGRTARAGREGLSVALVTEYDVELIQRIERKTQVRMALWKERAMREANVLKVLDEVSAAKVQAKQQVTEQFGNRVSSLKEQTMMKRQARDEEVRRARRSSSVREEAKPRRRTEVSRQIAETPTDDAQATEAGDVMRARRSRAGNENAEAQGESAPSSVTRKTERTRASRHPVQKIKSKR